MIEYAETQKTGSPYALSIPRFYTTAFDNLRSQGFVFRLKKGLADEVVFIYLTIQRIHSACDRQEDLATGAAATSPLAGDLRIQNLDFIASMTHNVVKPRLEKLLLGYRGR